MYIYIMCIYTYNVYIYIQLDNLQHFRSMRVPVYCFSLSGASTSKLGRCWEVPTSVLPVVPLPSNVPRWRRLTSLAALPVTQWWHRRIYRNLNGNYIDIRGF